MLLFFKKVYMLLCVCIWMCVTYYAQASLEVINSDSWLDDGLSNLSVPMTIIRELGFKTGRSPNYVIQITINGKIYGGDDGIDQGSIKLDENEHFNEFEYQISEGSILNYVSFCTNKKRCVSGGAKEEYFPQEARHRLGVRVFAIGGRASLNVNKLVVLYDDDNPASQVKAVNATFIVDVTPPSQEMVVYLNPDAKMKESYLKSIYDTGFGEVEYLVKLAVNMGNSSLEIKYPYRRMMEEALIDDLGSESSIKHVIPEGHVGVKFSLGEILRQPNVYPEDKHWMFPTSGTWYSVINTSDVSSLLDRYDLKGRWSGLSPGYFPDLEKYKREKFGFVYYSDKNE